jgi:hypothetical protein
MKISLNKTVSLVDKFFIIKLFYISPSFLPTLGDMSQKVYYRITTFLIGFHGDYRLFLI